MRKIVLAFAAAALLGAGCRDDDEPTKGSIETDPQEMPTCDELFGEGVTLRDDAFDIACTSDDEPQGAFYGASTRDCADGRTLHWMAFGWGYAGEPWHTGATEPPQAELDACDAGQ